jgi:uracil-DNA glycosylase family 4
VSRRELELIGAEVVDCRRCPRLVAWRERVARDRVARFADEEYWGRPVPGFGDPRARILVVGLAPAAHGGNRTGRIFTGDRSGDFLYGSLFRAGLSNRARSVDRSDGLRLRDAYVAAVNRCAPPGNRPTTQERDACLPYLRREIEALERLRVVLALGSFAWDGALRALAGLGHHRRPKPRFGHGAQVEVGPYLVLGSYHPSQQNTFTGKLTAEMLDAVVRRAAELAGVSGTRARPTPRRDRGSDAGTAPGRTPG